MSITVILGAQWGMFLSLTWNMTFLRTRPISDQSHDTDQDFHRRRRREYSEESNTADGNWTLMITRTQKGKLVDGQCQEAQLCARAAVSTTQAESGRLTASTDP
jgi:hypothetical protein